MNVQFLLNSFWSSNLWSCRGLHQCISDILSTSYQYYTLTSEKSIYFICFYFSCMFDFVGPLHKQMEASLLRSRLFCLLTFDGGKLFLWGQQCKYIVQRRQVVWKRSKGIHPCQTGTTAFEVSYHPTTMQYWVLSPGSLTTIHTRVHLTLATHMKAGLINNSQVTSTTQL